MAARHQTSEGPEGQLTGDQLEASAHARDRKTEYLTARQLAEVLQISEATIHRLRRAGRIPAVMLTERLIRFNLRDVQRALRPHRAHGGEVEGQEHDQTPSPQLTFDDFDSHFEQDSD